MKRSLLITILPMLLGACSSPLSNTPSDVRRAAPAKNTPIDHEVTATAPPKNVSPGALSSHQVSPAIEGRALRTANPFAMFDEMAPRETVEAAVNAKKTHINLQSLAGYLSLIKKSDLVALESPSCRTRIKSISFNKLELSDQALEAVSNLQLETLDLNDSKCEDLHAIRNMLSLTTLSLSHAPLNSAGYAVIKGLKNIRTLDLSQTDVTEREVEELSTLPHIVWLGLANCPNITSDIVSNLKKGPFRNCEIVYEPGEPDRASNDRSKLLYLVQQGSYDEAERGLQRMVRKLEHEPKPNYDEIGQSYTLLGYNDFQRHVASSAMLPRNSQARQMYEKAIKILSNGQCKLSSLLRALFEYASCLESNHEFAEAITVRQRWDKIANSQSNSFIKPGFDNQAQNLILLGSDFAKLNNASAASDAYYRASYLCSTTYPPLVLTALKGLSDEHCKLLYLTSEAHGKQVAGDSVSAKQIAETATRYAHDHSLNDASSNLALGYMYYQDGHPEQATSLLAKALEARLKTNPGEKTPNMFFALGSSYLQISGQPTMSDLRKAEYWLKKVVTQTDSSHPRLKIQAQEALSQVQIKKKELANPTVSDRQR